MEAIRALLFFGYGGLAVPPQPRTNSLKSLKFCCGQDARATGMTAKSTVAQASSLARSVEKIEFLRSDSGDQGSIDRKVNARLERP
jgi:hypothetical protein